MPQLFSVAPAEGRQSIKQQALAAYNEAYTQRLPRADWTLVCQSDFARLSARGAYSE